MKKYLMFISFYSSFIICALHNNPIPPKLLRCIKNGDIGQLHRLSNDLNVYQHFLVTETTVLHLAIKYQQLEMFETFLQEYKLNPNKQNRYGESPLHYIMLQKKLNNDLGSKMICALLKAGANVELKNNYGTPFVVAARRGKFKWAKLILERGSANVDAKWRCKTDSNGIYVCTALSCACDDGDDLLWITYLLEHGADPNQKLCCGTPLYRLIEGYLSYKCPRKKKVTCKKAILLILEKYKGNLLKGVGRKTCLSLVWYSNLFPMLKKSLLGNVGYHCQACGKIETENDLLRISNPKCGHIVCGDCKYLKNKLGVKLGTCPCSSCDRQLKEEFVSPIILVNNEWIHRISGDVYCIKDKQVFCSNKFRSWPEGRYIIRIYTKDFHAT